MDYVLLNFWDGYTSVFLTNCVKNTLVWPSPTRESSKIQNLPSLMRVQVLHQFISFVHDHNQLIQKKLLSMLLSLRLLPIYKKKLRYYYFSLNSEAEASEFLESRIVKVDGLWTSYSIHITRIQKVNPKIKVLTTQN